MMDFEDPSVLENYVKDKAKSAMPQKVYNNRSIYLSHFSFGPLKSLLMLPKLGDFGLAQRGDKPEPLRRLPIQPPVYQAPEVLLGIPWSYSADIWNLGILVSLLSIIRQPPRTNVDHNPISKLWNLLENQDLYRDITSDDGRYYPAKHLAEMIALFGPPPKELLKLEEKWRLVKYPNPPPSRNLSEAKGQHCWTAYQFYGGPFFSPHGTCLSLLHYLPPCM